MRNLQLAKAAQITGARPDSSLLKWAATREAFSAFKANVIRTARMIEVPAYSALTADIHRLAMHRICKGEPTEKRASRIPHLGKKVDQMMGEIINQDADFIRSLLAGAILNLDTFIAQTENAGEIFESFLNGILIQAWTSIEVLTRDLLRLSIQKHPECFGSMPAEEVTRLSTHSFQKLETIRSAYGLAFSGSVPVVNPINEQCVDALYLLRNLLVHRGGQIDAKFLGECGAKYLTGWESFQSGIIHLTQSTEGG